MNSFDLNELAELIEAKDRVVEHLNELNAKLDEYRKLDRSRAIAIIQTLMSIHGITTREAVTWRPTAQALQESSVFRKRSAPKYKHPVSGLTWAGRGLRPRWLQAELAAGKSLESFSVDQQLPSHD